jgi:thiamine transporter
MTQTSNRRAALLRIAEGGVMLCLATVLSVFKLADLPYGGSITLASLFPIMLLSFRHGTGFGLFCGLVYGVIQQLLGLNTLSYFSTWYSIVAIILLDYLLAFAAAGLGGIFKNKIKNKGLALLLGGFTVCLVRYLCHVISGCTVWAGMSIPTGGALVYSLIYNATYMIPETVILMMVSYYLGSGLDFSLQIPKRIKRSALPFADWARLLGGGALFAGLIFDVTKIFAKIQNAETGEFDLTALTGAPFSFFLPMIVVTAAALGIFALLSVLAVLAEKKKTE